MFNELAVMTALKMVSASLLITFILLCVTAVIFLIGAGVLFADYIEECRDNPLGCKAGASKHAMLSAFRRVAGAVTATLVVGTIYGLTPGPGQYALSKLESARREDVSVGFYETAYLGEVASRFGEWAARRIDQQLHPELAATEVEEVEQCD